MTSTKSPLPSVRPRRPEDDARLVTINRLNNPDRPPLSVEEMRHGMASQPAHAHAELWVAEIDGHIVGDIGWNRLVYIENQNTWWSYLYVDPAHHNKGVGSRLFDWMIESVRRRRAEKVLCVVREDRFHAIEFVEHRGFTPSGPVSRLSRLDVGSARVERSGEASRRLDEQGIRIATMAEIGQSNERFLEALHRMSDETERDVPGSWSYNGMPYEDWYEDVFRTPGSSPETFWVALDGDRPVGLALLTERADGWVDNHYTGVARAYRGRSIARALKLRTVEWARQHGVRAMMTGNDASNKAMLAINIDLGYQPVAAGIEMVKELGRD